MTPGGWVAAVGVDGCPGGWVAAVDDGSAITWRFAGVDDVAELLLPGAVVGVDMPIGLLDTGLRACDALLRGELPGAGPRVFTTPPRPVLELGLSAPNDEVQVLSRRLIGQGVSRQALGLATRILALDAALTTTGADVVALARASLADPDWFVKVRTGHGDAVNLCIYANYCEALGEKHEEVTCQLWDRTGLDEPGVRRTKDGKRRLTPAPWVPPTA